MKILASLLFAAALALCPAAVRAASLDEAHAAFAAGRYHDSTLGYQAVLAQNGYSAPVLFDLGNSLYREGDYANAILAYKRAQWLAPNDPDIAANLAQAQKQAGLAPGLPAWYMRPANFLSATQWAWLACAAWIVFCAALLLRALLPQRASLCVFAAMLSAFILADAIAAIVISSGALRQAVVTDKNASALISPFPAAQKMFSPTPGDTLTVEKSYEDFDLVSDSSGHSGWISKTQITPIVPAS
jgi:tetratricopeptide (TPR) repeat protein